MSDFFHDSSLYFLLFHQITTVWYLHFQTDKASMLDEAIEYLKMLQVQLQVFFLPNAFHPLAVV